MKRYLLFDSGCCQCSKIAKSIEQEASGKLTIRSLRDPAVKELLDRERPGWKWEPMLLEEKGNGVRIYAGGAMSRRLLVVLGPRRAWRMVKLLDTMMKPEKDIDVGRRAFFQQMAVFSVLGVLSPGILKGAWADNPTNNAGGSHSLLMTRGIIPSSQLDDSTKLRIREAVASDAAFQYMYLVSTNAQHIDMPKLVRNLEVVGYSQEYDVYLVGLKFKVGSDLSKLVDRRRAEEEKNEDHVLAVVYSPREGRSLSVRETYASVDDDDVVIGYQYADSTIVVKAPVNKVAEMKVIRYEYRPIQESIAMHVGYDYKRDTSLRFYQRRLVGSQSVEHVEGNCEWVCDLVSVIGCYLLPPPVDLFCGVFMVLVCHEVCDPECVGEGCP